MTRTTVFVNDRKLSHFWDRSAVCVECHKIHTWHNSGVCGKCRYAKRKRSPCERCKKRMSDYDGRICCRCAHPERIRVARPCANCGRNAHDILCKNCKSGATGRTAAHRGCGLCNHEPRLPDSPTAARPGSEEKLLVFLDRVATGRHLHHPGDVRITRDED